MRKQWIAALGILVLALTLGGWAEAVPVNTCADTGGTEHIVDTAPEAADIGANGYNSNTCELIIQISIPVTVSTLTIAAESITIDPAGGPTPLVDVEIINNAAGSVCTFSATGGNLEITNGILKCHKILNLGATGDIIARLSELIAAAGFGPPPAGLGDLFIKAMGSVDIQTTATHGGGIMEVRAKEGTITFICGGETNGCKDPIVSNKAVELCGTCPIGDTCPPDPRVPPTIFPCDVTFDTQEELREVCFPVPPGVQCDGGSKEKRFEAFGDIDIHGTTLTSTKHMTFTSNTGNLLAAGAKLTVFNDRLKIDVRGTVDISNSMITTASDTTIIARAGCPPKSNAYPTNVCINANGAVIEASDVSMTANLRNGVIDLCGTAAADLTKTPTDPLQPLGATRVNAVGVGEVTLNGDDTPPYSHINGGGVETILNGAAECTALGKFGAYIECSGAGGSCPPGIIDP